MTRHSLVPEERAASYTVNAHTVHIVQYLLLGKIQIFCVISAERRVGFSMFSGKESSWGNYPVEMLHGGRKGISRHNLAFRN